MISEDDIRILKVDENKGKNIIELKYDVKSGKFVEIEKVIRNKGGGPLHMSYYQI